MRWIYSYVSDSNAAFISRAGGQTELSAINQEPPSQLWKLPVCHFWAELLKEQRLCVKSAASLALYFLTIKAVNLSLCLILLFESSEMQFKTEASSV